MSKYANRTGTNRGERGPAHDPDEPSAPGFYRLNGRDRVPSVVKVWRGPPIDPVTGEEVPERGERWQAAKNGVPVPLDSVWPDCARSPISQAEHDRLAGQHRTMDPDSPFYDARKRIDPLTARLPW